MELEQQIWMLAKDRFENGLVEEFIQTLDRLTAGATVVDSILQISTDEGEELEIGFFTPTTIGDITLSNGKIYSCVYPLADVQKIDVSDLATKWTLTITGEKKFDYNVVKPGSIEILKKYELSLREHLA